MCFKEKILDALAEAMPTERQKEEVPRWFVLAANLSLKLHLENSFYAFERVVRCGGLLWALSPEIASKHLAPKTQQILLECRGFNDKNHYSRATPCDQDFLRKFVRDVSAADWQAWFNGAVQRTFQAYGFFDPAGIFIGDGSYLFVPDNPEYEGSAVMWFDEHNHPVKYEELSAQERKKAHRERCYKLVSLLHLRGDCYVYAALAVVPGNAHECPVLYQLVEQFVKQVGKGAVHDLRSPAATEPQLIAEALVHPTRLCESRKRSVPVRVHSVYQSSGSSAPAARRRRQPVIDSRHGRITCKTFSSSSTIAKGEHGRLQSVNEGFAPTPYHGWQPRSQIQCFISLLLGCPNIRLGS